MNTKTPATLEQIQGGWLVRWGGGWSVRIRDHDAAIRFATAKGYQQQKGS
jgi:hypothetical protein